jgi:hypothetical protein
VKERFINKGYEKSGNKTLILITWCVSVSANTNIIKTAPLLVGGSFSQSAQNVSGTIIPDVSGVQSIGINAASGFGAGGFVSESRVMAITKNGIKFYGFDTK